jgi:hypothetical protein
MDTLPAKCIGRNHHGINTPGKSPRGKSWKNPPVALLLPEKL